MICELPQINSKVKWYPYAVTLHTHGKGRIISVYKVNPKLKKWTKLAQNITGLPAQILKKDTMNTDESIYLESKDLIAIRCTYVSNLIVKIVHKEWS